MTKSERWSKKHLICNLKPTSSGLQNLVQAWECRECGQTCLTSKEKK